MERMLERQERIAQRVLKANQLYNVPGPVKSLVSIINDGAEWLFRLYRKL